LVDLQNAVGSDINNFETTDLVALGENFGTVEYGIMKVNDVACARPGETYGNIGSCQVRTGF